MTDSTPEWVKTAKVGDKLVCINNDKFSQYALRINKIYTIHNLYAGNIHHIDVVGVANVGITVVLVEVRFDPRDGQECCFHPTNFRPVQTSKSTSKEVAKLSRMAKDHGKVAA